MVAAPPFQPGGAFCFENFDANDYHPDASVRDANECDGDPAPAAAADVRIEYCVGWNDDCTLPDIPVADAALGMLISFTPSSFSLPPGNSLPVGALAGRLDADSTAGAFGNPCNITLNTWFTLMSASTNTAETISPLGPGRPDVMAPLAMDADANTLADGVDRYPSFLQAHFDPDLNFGPDRIPFTADDRNGPVPTMQPKIRLAAFSKVYGDWVSVQLLIFDPGVTLPSMGGPMALGAEHGYPTALVVQDPTAPPGPSRSSDVCAPFRVNAVLFGETHDNPCTGIDTLGTTANCPAEVDPLIDRPGYPSLPCEVINSIDEDADARVNDGCPMVGNTPESGTQCDNATSDDAVDGDSSINDGCPAFGSESEAAYVGSGCNAMNEGGCTLRRNPASPGDLVFTAFSASLRDTDGDRLENELDVCALKPNPGWNPRVAGSDDPDRDGMPADCDPRPNDNCPRDVSPPCSPNSPPGCERGILGPDYDQDCYANRQDNCPLANQLKNPSQPPSFSVPPQLGDNTPQMLDTDKDGIGDACDITSCPAADTPAYRHTDCLLFGTSIEGPFSGDGDHASGCITFTISVQTGGHPRAAGPAHSTDPNCAGQSCPHTMELDCDRDGFTGKQEAGSPLCSDGRNEDNMDDAIADDGCPGGPPQSGLFSEASFNINASDQDPCGEAGWPLDLVSTDSSANKIDVVDLNSYVAPIRRIGAKPGDPGFDERWDLKPGRGVFSLAWINVEDLAGFTAGSTAHPPMLGGIRAFDAVCPWPP